MCYTKVKLLLLIFLTFILIEINSQKQYNNILINNNQNNVRTIDLVGANKYKKTQEKTKIDTLSSVFKKSFNKVKNKSKKVDVIFLIDSSSSVGRNNFLSEIKFVKKLLSDFTVSYNNTRVSVITFSSQGKITRHIDQISYPKEENDKCRLLNYEIPKIRFVGGGTYTYGALKKAKETFTKARPDSKKIIFLITDGFSNGRDPVPIAKQLKNDNISIFTIGIQTGNYAELYNISSSPGDQHSFLLDSFPQFESLARKALHSDYRTGRNMRVSDQTLCNALCKPSERLANGTIPGSCCDINANCVCGTTSGHYSCMCQPGYYGAGLKNTCELCPTSTFWQSSNLCRPCPDINQITIKIPATSVTDCVCKTGFKMGESNRCEVITCPQLSPPENGYFVKHPTGCGHVLNAACGSRCSSGYQLSGSSIRVCQEDRTWSGSEANCVLKTCPFLPIPYYGLVVCKNADLNLKFDYSPRNQTFIEKYDDESLRITEPMPIDTDCNFKCGPGFYLVGSANRNCLPLSKWDGIQTACKQILCPVLPLIPFGEYDPTDCAEQKPYHGSNCTLTCDPGFELKGPATKHCGGKRTGVWSQKLKTPRCVDIENPSLTCPDNYTVPIKADENFALIQKLELPEVSDNSHLNVTFWSKPAIKDNEIKLFIGVHTFTYIAVDSSKNKARCNFTITVIDETPPVFENCINPSDFFINVLPPNANNSDNYIEWEDPTIYDNSNGPITVKQNLEPGFLGIGIHKVEYTATDEYNNTNNCIMNITVKELKCEPLLSSQNGNTICAKNQTHLWCEVTCNSGYAIFDELEEDNLDNLKLFCENNNPKWTYPIIPDCTLIKLPTHVEEIFSISLDSNTTICNDTNATETIQNELLLQVREHFCEDQIDCEIVSGIPLCEEKEEENQIDVSEKTFYNIVKRDVQSVNGTTQKRRIVRSKAQIRINIYTKVSKRLGLWEQNATRSENVKRVKAELRTLPYNEKLQKQLIAMKINLSILKLDHIIRCENGSISKQFVCVECPAGTFHNQTSIICQSCPIGSYSNLPGQIECTQCPINYATKKIQSKTVDDCREQCYPGSIARLRFSKKYKMNPKQNKSLMPFCRKCNPGEYQPFYNQLTCEKCPEGYTSTRGSTKLNDCYPKHLQPCVKYKTICGSHGQCIPELKRDYLYSCLCDDGFIGAHCEHKVNLCYSTPCINGGICHTVNNSVFCECPSQYKGEFCETKIDLCEDKVCKNNGQCIDINGRSFCECDTGFAGEFCEVSIDYCENSPCVFGECINRPYGFYCHCAPGTIGRRCHLKPCDYLPCSRNAICIDLLHLPATRDSYMCKCPIGYKGKDCNEIDNPCDKRPCKNNGHCTPLYIRNVKKFSHYVSYDGDEKYEMFTCKCPPYFYGNICQIFSTPDYVLSFDTVNINDYVQIAGPVEHLKEMSFCTWLQTNDTFNYGVILSYASLKSDNMFTFTDYNGIVLYVDGNHIITDITLNDGFWHFVCVSWSSEYGLYEIYLDGQLHNTGYNLSTGSYIEANGSITLGQEQDELGTSFSESESFIGKIAYFDIWSQALTPQNVQEYYFSCEPYQGNLISWTDFKINIKGHVKILQSPFCKPCPEDLHLNNGMVRILDNRAYYYCKNGYQLRGSMIRHCLRTSEWEYPEPSCIAINCGPIYPPINGYVQKLQTTLGEQVKYSCNTGYKLFGEETRICLQNGTWENIPTPECRNEENECDAFYIENSSIIYANEMGPMKMSLTKYPIGTLAEIQCMNNTSPNGETFIACLENGSWDNLPSICVPITQTKELNLYENMNKNTKYEITWATKPKSEFSLNTTIQEIILNLMNQKDHPDRKFWQNLKDFLFYGCSTENNHNQSIFCKNSIHDFTDLTNFDTPGSDEYQNMDEMFLKFLQDAVVSQIQNTQQISPENLLEFILYGNSTTLKYESTIETTYRLVLCFYIDGILLEDEFNIENSPINANKQIHLLIEYLVAPIYDEYNLKKNAKTCPSVELPKNVLIFPNLNELQQTFEIGTELNYNCENGKKLNGEPIAKCLEDGKWSNINVICESIFCDNPPRPISMTIITPKPNKLYEIGDKVEYQCRSGYSIYGNPIIECLSNGKWTKILARCSKISCNKPKLTTGIILIGRSYLYQDILKIQCIDSNILEIECKSDGKWHPDDVCK